MGFQTQASGDRASVSAKVCCALCFARLFTPLFHEPSHELLYSANFGRSSEGVRQT